MPSENVTKLMGELISARTVIEPQIEGWKDLQRTNIQPATKTVVDGELVRYNRRHKAINDAIGALETLNADGYPAMSNVEVSDSVMNDMLDQYKSIGAAVAKVGPEQANNLGIAGDAPVDK